MSEQNKALYRQFIDRIFNERDLDAIDELISSDFVDHDPVPGTAGGRSGLKHGLEMFVEAFPDVRSTVNFLVAEGDLVVGHHTTTGRHQGEFMGVPATGKSVTVDEIHIVRIVNGQAVEHWGLANDMAMLAQLGVMAPGVD